MEKKKDLAKNIIRQSLDIFIDEADKLDQGVNEFFEKDEIAEAVVLIHFSQRRLSRALALLNGSIKTTSFLLEDKKDSPLDELMPDSLENDCTNNGAFTMTTPRSFGIMQAETPFTGDARLNNLVDYAKGFLDSAGKEKKMGTILDSLTSVEELLKMQPENSIYINTRYRLLDELENIMKPTEKPLEELENASDNQT